MFEMMMQQKDEKIAKLEKNQNKVAWLIVSAVIVALLALVV
jgi:hypothetical protein